MRFPDKKDKLKKIQRVLRGAPYWEDGISKLRPDWTKINKFAIVKGQNFHFIFKNVFYFNNFYITKTLLKSFFLSIGNTFSS